MTNGPHDPARNNQRPTRYPSGQQLAATHSNGVWRTAVVPFGFVLYLVVKGRMPRCAA
ncbi:MULTISPECIES: hypothetical protein [unclassified Pseudomonas]|uniref:hypothetical protein n=1 Tax=unclassified Pseudomonas TaxID=196821 RepID=UPI0020970B20|nr:MULTISPECIES: hypothetical protein [unclassified Pseudomonas]MCO7521903.1 hypothetical protein [Pseudomonas sp. 1]MCO7542387.1 hypothetical protein [Pseudomonas sp. VA159-2]